MNCHTAQRRLLGSERPDEPPPEVEAHLAACGTCRAWQQRLAATPNAAGAAFGAGPRPAPPLRPG